MRFWSKNISVKILALLAIFSLFMSAAFFFIYFFSEGINTKSLKALVSFVSLTLLFSSTILGLMQMTKKNRWFALLGLVLISFPIIALIVNFLFDSFFVYDSWKLLLISFLSGIVVFLLLIAGFLSGKEVRFKWFQQLLSFSMIVLALASIYFILESFTSLIYMDTLLIGFSVCVIFLCIHTWWNFIIVEVEKEDHLEPSK